MQLSMFPRDEVEAAFQHYWRVGCVEEDWAAWTQLFVPDVFYVDHFWGPLHGRDEVGTWIDAVMKGVPEIYTVLDWYVIDGDRVVFRCENRRDNPAAGAGGGADGPAYWDFPGLSVLRYAGDGQWASGPVRRTTGIARAPAAPARSTPPPAGGPATPAPSSG
jgi:hypothetical protein